MESMFANVADNPMACGAGLIGMISLAIWPLFRSRSSMLMVYICNNLAFAVHYGLLEDWTASSMNVLMSVQTLVAIWIAKDERLRWIYYVLMVVLAGMTFATWYGLPSFFAAMAAAFSTIGRMQRNEIALRTLVLASVPFWLAHDIVVSSMPGFTADVLSLAIGSTMLLQRLYARYCQEALVGYRAVES